jgi:AAA domain-containing protein
MTSLDVNDRYRAGELPADLLVGTAPVWPRVNLAPSLDAEGEPARLVVSPVLTHAIGVLENAPANLTAEWCDAADAAIDGVRLDADARARGDAPAIAVRSALAALQAANGDPATVRDCAERAGAALATARVAAGMDPGLILGARPVTGMEIFATLPPVQWLCKDLQWSPGRPAQVQGYGGSGKTIAVTDAAVALVSGRLIWGWFRTGRELRGIHFDYDQGRPATLRRYQRIALGAGVDRREVADRLVIVPRPPVRLTDFEKARPLAVSTFCKAVDGRNFAIIDAFRGLTAGADENDSRARDYLDILGDVSEKTGCTFIFLHHAGKGRSGPGNERPDTEAGRGSSAIQDGSGSVLLLSSAPGHASTVSVKMTRDSADRDGPRPEPHYLTFVDVAVDGNPTAGLRVEYRTVEQVEGGPSEGKGTQKRVLAYREILKTVARSPGCTVNEVKGANIGLGSAAAGQAIDALLGRTLGAALVNRGETARGKARALHLAEGVDPETWEPPVGALVAPEKKRRWSGWRGGSE